MRKTVVCQKEDVGAVGQQRVLARCLADELRRVRGNLEATIQASGTPTDVNSQPDYTFRGFDGDLM
jgi:hypothetical protein